MMIVQPDFLDHWKTQLLVQLTGDKASPLLVLRLWAHCQQRRQWVFDNMTPQVLKAVCRWEGEPDQLQKALTDSGFIEVNGSAVNVHEWAAVNASLVRSWQNGHKGGRPRKTQRKPSGNPGETDKSREDESRQEYEYPTHEESIGPGREIPCLEAVNGHAAVIGLHPDEAGKFFDYYEQRGWTDRNGQPVRNWQAALRRWKVTAQERASMARTAAGGGDRKPIRADYDNPNDPLLGTGGKTP